MLDAMLQDPIGRTVVESAVVEPLVAAGEARHRSARARAGTTRVEFFTMVRGEE